MRECNDGMRTQICTVENLHTLTTVGINKLSMIIKFWKQ